MNILISLLLISFVSTIDIDHTLAKSHKQGGLNCKGEGYTLATRDDGNLICYLYMSGSYIRKHNIDNSNDTYFNYKQSKQICEGIGEHWTLTDVKGPFDAKNVYKNVDGKSEYTFLSGTKASAEDSWKWVDGSSITQYDGWLKGQPDDPQNQFCLRMDYGDAGKYRDVECNLDDHRANAVLCQSNAEGSYGYSKVEKRYCSYKGNVVRNQSFSSLEVAIRSCTDDENCRGIYDYGCNAEANKTYLCPNSATYVESGSSCIYQKNTGVRGRTSQSPSTTPGFTFEDTTIRTHPLTTGKETIADASDCSFVESENEMVTGIIIGGAAMFCLACLVGIIIFFWLKNSKNSRNMGDTEQALIPDSREISIESLISRTVQEPSKKEFDELDKKGKERGGIKGDLTDAQGRRYNEEKYGKMNIKKNVIPYDQNRVVLRTPIIGSDYINATWLQRIKANDLYDDLYDFLPSTSMNIILTQTPTSDTRQHYLQLINDQRIDVLINIGSDKDFPNWDRKSFGNLSSELIERIDVDDFIFQERIDVSARHGKSIINHTTTVYNFTGWPSNDTFSEKDSKNLLTFINFVRREIGKPSKDFTMAVHDSDGGVGGAATFIVLHQMMQDVDSKILERDSGQEEIGSLNIFRTVDELRKQRAHIIETFSNYKFLFKTLSYYASKRSTFDTKLTQKQDDEESNIFTYYYETMEEEESQTITYVN